MTHPGLIKIAATLESPVHLAVCDDEVEQIEVIAIREDSEWQDAFPLPIDLQSAAADAEMILDTTSAVRINPSQLPADFWDSSKIKSYGDNLTLTVLARAGRKYLHFFRAVREEQKDPASLRALALSQAELSQLSLWIREHAFFNHQKGDYIMRLLLILSAPGV